MQAATISRLLDINRQFYQTFAADFSATRGRIQPGVRTVLDRLGGSESILDLGCSNGQLLRHLARIGHQGAYQGLDFSPGLLTTARQIPAAFLVSFLQADLAARDWDASLPPGGYTLALAFATLHHIPSAGVRLQILQKISRLLGRPGRFIHSHWQYLNSPRLQHRIQPWELAGIQPEEVDPGDHLLDWRQGGHGLRYVHHFDQAELDNLAAASGFRVCETFHSDGEGGRLGLYQIWEVT